MPELNRHYCRQTQLYGEARQGTFGHPTKSPPPVMHRRDVKISGATQRFFAQELSNECRFRFDVKTVQRSAENNLAALIFVPILRAPRIRCVAD